jgi:hypothetical protein
MGMAWDTGAPVWPYETPWIVFAIVNAPAALAGMAFSNLAGIQAFGERLPVYLTAAILLWFSVGTSIDRGVYRRQVRAKSWLFAVVAGAGLACLCLGLVSISSGVHWWSSYGAWSTSSMLIFARLVAIMPWCALILVVSIRIVYSSLRVRQDVEC